MINEQELEEEEGTGQNRLFVTLAIALIGLLVLGLLGVGAVFIIRQNMSQQAVAVMPSPTLLIRLPNPTATFTPVAPKPTNTPLPTPTNTPVLTAGGGQEAAIGGGSKQQGGDQPATPTPKPIPTRTPVPQANGNTVPQTGFGGLEVALIAIGLAAIVFIVRRLRLSSN